MLALVRPWGGQLLLTLVVALAACGPDQVADYEIWAVNGSGQPAVLVLTTSSQYTHVPNLLSRPSSGLARSGAVDQPASGFRREVLIYDLDCDLIEVVVVSDGDWLLEITADGEVFVSPFSPPAEGAEMLSEAQTACSASPPST